MPIYVAIDISHIPNRKLLGIPLNDIMLAWGGDGQKMTFLLSPQLW